MTFRKWMCLVVAIVCATASRSLHAQQFTTLEIEWENGVNYFADTADPTRLATSAATVNPSVRNFMYGTAIADIVSVNGKPAKGSWVGRSQLVMLVPNPAPGQAIGDIGRPVIGDIYIEILQNDGTRVGTIIGMGSPVGAAPPGSPAAFVGNLTVIGGTGAFVGARGTLTGPQYTFRAASVQEDPANRRTHGGGRGRYIVNLIPWVRPELVRTAGEPGIFHQDFSPVTSVRPARAGETLILMATGLGPTRPGISEGAPFAQNPLQEVNSPVEVTLSGMPANVINKIGWPGTTDTYRVDIRVPGGVEPGTAVLQLTVAFIQAPPVSIPVQ
jgi:uncharacterized protein (TIGR03437 family)